ncbi:MAG: phosphatidylcholine/phosphatidylserine synthase [Planctomycetota bacterium]|jgi:CDP-diacylglycerol--serine O-phosphatidyltransferase|nr:phosphatidylcholine/phosphatidylserine synthase [Planctomycetota bacterium]MDP6988215.1 phosphatidylcholine/phosphatidylserine synthase [Planctomycetota bacterium]
MKPIAMLPNLLTLANGACGLLALSKSIDALAWHDQEPGVFYEKMEAACFLVFLAMLFDGLDGWVARLTRSYSDFGGQLDSLADVVTFGVAPAMIAKAFFEHTETAAGVLASPRLHFAAAGCYALMAMLRLARFNLESDHDASAHADFRGLPSPAAAGAVASTVWIHLILSRPELELSEGTPTPLGRVMGWTRDVDWGWVLAWIPPLLTLALPLIGLLMVSRVRYVHAASHVTTERSHFFALVTLVFVGLGLYLAPVPLLFVTFNGFVLYGVVRWLWSLARDRRTAAPDGDALP